MNFIKSLFSFGEGSIAEKSVSYTSNSFFSSAVRKIFYPADGSKELPYFSEKEMSTIRVQLEKSLNGTSFALPCSDGVHLDAMWCKGENPLAPTAVLFHGNNCTMLNMGRDAKWYKDHGMNVLMLTIRGYPGSEGSMVESGEMGAYLDTEAAMNYVIHEKGISRDKVLVHSLSIGGLNGGFAAKHYGVTPVLVNTLISPKAVACKVGRELAGFWAFPLIIRGSVSGAFPKGITKSLCDGDRTFEVITDSFNNLEHIKSAAKHAFIFSAKEDEIMPPSFAEDFFIAQHGNEPKSLQEREVYLIKKDEHIAWCEGYHNDSWINSPEAVSKYEAFLRRNGFIH